MRIRGDAEGIGPEGPVLLQGILIHQGFEVLQTEQATLESRSGNNTGGRHPLTELNFLTTALDNPDKTSFPFSYQ